ncbi:hypothetical protein [Roseisolibacter agri]|uniref:Uncharacterized protein n=1 Tax=Roseisolibacter agri TaxID=2014610 RepID=A0AA37QBB3_9BACT|nr:hypothetical protein [Roseisolibacter agri]GLC25761.1 hypothetical protein rosag_22740 [Roseisolibacter agri]
MDPAAGRRFLTELTETERRKYVDQVRLIAALGIVGLALITTGSLLTGVLLTDYWKWLLTLGGGFIASLSSVRLNDLYGTKARLGALAQLLSDFERASAPLTDVPPAELAKLSERVERLYDRTLGL